MKRVLVLLTWLVFGGILLAQEPPAANEMVIERLFFGILDSLHVSSYFDSSGVQLQVTMNNPEKKAFCRSRLIKYFSRHNIPVFLKEKRSRIVIEEFKPKVEYSEPTKEILGFSGAVQRNVSLAIKGWLEPAKKQRGMAYLELILKQTDVIPKDTVAELEKSPYSFTYGKWISYSRWTRFLEPALIIGSVSVLIYLFYSLRT